MWISESKKPGFESGAPPLNCELDEVVYFLILIICETGMGGRRRLDDNGYVMHLAQIFLHGQH